MDKPKNRGRSAPRSAAERGGFKMDVKAAALRDLMTEQSKQDGRWATFYTGTGVELAKAGFPEHRLPRDKKQMKLRINGNDAYIQRIDGAFELTLTWDYRGPWYLSAEHPALSEIARMLLIDMSNWTGRWNSETREVEVPIDRLVSDGRAVDYRLPASKRFKFGPDFHAEMFNLTGQLYNAIKQAEIMPLEDTTRGAEELEQTSGENVLSLAKMRAARGSRR